MSMNKLTRFKNCGSLKATVTGKLIYLILDELADQNGEIIVPQKRISSALGISQGSVSRNLRRLRDAGYIRVYARYHLEGGRLSNKYVIR